jgi:16S rRNA (adenine1518-N6/adenine1519-N6)-dimethyltransferase
MSLATLSYVRDLLARHKIRLKKSLGQHFLVDENILKKIATAAQLSPEDTVLEIGAGIGTLTQEIAPRAGRVIAVEIDRRFIPLLEEHLRPYENVTIVNQDFLQLDLRAIALDTKIAIVGNLPYGVTAPILEKLIEAHDILTAATLLVQAEVAEKLCAAPGTREASALTIFVQSFAHVQRLFSVSRSVFFPMPEVDSACVRLEFRERPTFCAPEDIFLKVVRAAFNLRRKTLRQALTRSPLLALPHEIVLKALERAQLDPQRRGETLSLEEFDRLAQALAALLQKE